MATSTDTRLLGGLDVLSAVVETGSFVRAGERLGLTQSGVSRAVARLEERIGVRLFDRNARAVALTDEGRRFHAEITPLLAAIEEAARGAASGKERVRGKLRINADAFFAGQILGPALPAFLGEYPDVELEVVVRDHVGNLVAEGFDAAVRFDEPEGDALIARRLLETRIFTCAAPAYLERHGRPRHPRDLAKGHECIQFRNPHTGRAFPWEFHAKRRRVLVVPVHGRLTVNDSTTGMAACIAGHGVAQLMEIRSRELLASGTIIDLFPDWHEELFPLYVIHPSRHLPSAKVRAFLDFVVRVAGTARAE